MSEPEPIAGQLDVYDVLQAGRVPELAEPGGRDASPVAAAAAAGDASRRARRSAGRVIGPGAPCDWCGEPIPAGSRADAECCGVVCRKRRWRFRQAATRPPTRPSSSRATRPAGPRERPMRFAYADPPYPGRAGYYVERTEVDHRELVARLEAGYPDGWALSTSADALYDVLPLCPRSVRVCVWRRRVRAGRSRRPLSAWEPLLVVGGRELATDEPQQLLDDLETGDVLLDASDVLDYRGRYDAFPGALVGMKPPEFAVWPTSIPARARSAAPGSSTPPTRPGSIATGRLPRAPRRSRRQPPSRTSRAPPAPCRARG